MSRLTRDVDEYASFFGDHHRDRIIVRDNIYLNTNFFLQLDRGIKEKSISSLPGGPG